MHRNLRVSFRIINRIVNAVQNTTQRPGTSTQQTIQLFAVIRSLDFFCIGFTNGCNVICINQAALEHVCILFKFQLVRREHIARQVGVINKVVDVPNALEFQVVNGHNRLCAPIKAMGCKSALEEYRNHTCLPVVAVNNVRMESDDRHGCQNCLTEENIAFNIPADRICIRLITLEIIFIINKVEGNALVFIFHDADKHRFTSLTIVHIEVGNKLEFSTVFPRNTSIVRQNNPHVIIPFIQGFWQCTNDICQTAGFDEWNTFRSCK